LYTAVEWLIAAAGGFLFGYGLVPFLWTQVALNVSGYWVWKWVVTRLIADMNPSTRESARGV